MQAHVAILVGPSLGTAKSRVLLGIDGMETRIWGVREDSNENAGADQESDEDEEEGAEAGSSADESESSAEEPEESDDDHEEDEDEDEDEADDDEEDGDEEGSADSEDDQPADSPPTSQPPPPTYTSHADEQRFLQTADRLLSRTLAAADAEGSGISSEMSAPPLRRPLLCSLLTYPPNLINDSPDANARPHPRPAPLRTPRVDPAAGRQRGPGQRAA